LVLILNTSLCFQLFDSTLHNINPNSGNCGKLALACSGSVGETSSTTGVLQQLETLPKFNTICYSLATINSTSERTNMNLVTYATAVGKREEKDGSTSMLWVVSLFKNTLSYELFMAEGGGILQVLDSAQAEICNILGKMHGTEVDKEKLCKEIGFPWENASALGIEAKPSLEGIKVLPGCLSYLTFDILSIQDAGDHDFALCKVSSLFGISSNDDEEGVETLRTGELRRDKII